MVSSFCFLDDPVEAEPTLPSSAPTSTVWPSLTLIFSKTPLKGDGTSTFTLSVSNSTSGSSESTVFSYRF